MNQQRLITNLLRLVEVPSISGSRAEQEIPFLLRDLLLEIDYFREHPEQISLLPVAEDGGARLLVCACLEGNGNYSDTVVLLSHYDVVDICGYGQLAKYAFRPLDLARELRQVSLPPSAASDLASGDYLFGRGVLDMKFGIALHIELLHHLAARRSTLPGNILFLSLPDEEGDSAGMRSAVGELLKYNSSGKNLLAAINSEPQFPRYPGDENRYIYTGTMGKLLPLVYCQGQPVHAGEPFAGLNPNLMLAEIIRHIELNPSLAGQLLGEKCPPPVCLGMSDNRTGYSVQTPPSAFAYFNVITLDKEPRQVMQTLKNLVHTALASAVDRVRTSAHLWSPVDLHTTVTWDPPVYSLDEFLVLCSHATGKTPAVLASEITAELAATDLREATAEFVRRLGRFSPVKDPFAVIVLAPPYYPHNYLTGSPGDRRIAEVAARLVERSRQQHGEGLSISPFFPALSDMSYLRLAGNPDASFLTANTPLWGSRYRVPLQEIAALSLPFLNIGPLGKDAHQFTERLNLPYSLRVTPDLVMYAIKFLLNLDYSDREPFPLSSTHKNCLCRSTYYQTQ